MRGRIVMPRKRTMEDNINDREKLLSYYEKESARLNDELDALLEDMKSE